MNESSFIYSIKTEYNDVYKIVRYYRNDEKGNIQIKSNGKKDIFFTAYTKEFNAWNKGLNCSKRYIYNLRVVTNNIENNKPIYFVEGEKCANILVEKLGLVGMTIAFGSNALKGTYKEIVRNYIKVINQIEFED